MTAKIIPAPAWLGVIGGGQIGRMFVQAAQAAGYRVAVYTDTAQSPAARAANRHDVGAYDDAGAVARFAKTVDALTFALEDVSALAAYAAAEHTVVRPQPRILATVQHRLREKQFLRSRGFPTAPFFYIRNGSELERALVSLGWNAVFKKAAGGRDGRGQVRIEGSFGLERAWGMLQSGAGVLEGWIDACCDLSVIVARNGRGEIATYGPMRNDHAASVLDRSVYPALAGDAIEAEAIRVAIEAAKALRLEGVLCVEVFVIRDGALLVNGITPHPHASGHLTVEAFASSQFDQQVRALCGLELGSTSPTSRAAVMVNLREDIRLNGPATPPTPESEVFFHIDDEAASQRGGDRGHITALGETAAAAWNAAIEARSALLGRSEPLLSA